MTDYLAWDGREYYEVKSDEPLAPLSILSVDEKLNLEQFRAEGIDDELKEPEKHRRELIAGLRYLGNSAWPRLQAGKPWGEWTKEDVTKYFAKIVDTLRQDVGYEIKPPPEGDEKWKTGYWQCYKAAQRYMKSADKKGGPGSGNWGHTGRPGKVGGSSRRGEGTARNTIAQSMIDEVTSKIPGHLLQGYEVVQDNQHSDAYFPDSKKLVLNDVQLLGYSTRKRALRHIAHELGHPVWHRVMNGDLPGYSEMPREYRIDSEKFAGGFAEYVTGFGGRRLDGVERAFFNTVFEPRKKSEADSGSQVYESKKGEVGGRTPEKNSLTPHLEQSRKQKQARFILTRRDFRGPIVIRFGSSTKVWDLYVRDGESWHLQLQGDPLKGETAGTVVKGEDKATDTDGKTQSVFDLKRGQSVDLKPGSALNPTKETPASLEVVDTGSAQALSVDKATRKYDFDGESLKGGYFFRAEDEKEPGGFWLMSKSGGPETKGGPGSGHFGHGGRPGKRGGSSPGGEGAFGSPKVLRAEERKRLDSWEDSPAKMVAGFAFDDSDHIVGVSEGKELVGVVGFSKSASGSARSPWSEPYIEVDFLASRDSGKGIGTSLMGHVIQTAAKQSSGVHLVADEDAIGFYRKIGMKLAGESRTWFHLSPSDCKQWRLPNE